MTPLDKPLHATMPIREARDRYLEENGFSVVEYDAKWTKASFLGIAFSIPNTKEHARAIMRHDLHHAATGFGTDLVGEGEISVFEVRTGLKGLDAYVSGIVLLGAAMGFLIAPRRALSAWQSAAGCRSLFAREASYEELLEGTLGDLRARMGLPAEGIAKVPRRLHSHAPDSQAKGAPTAA